MTSIDFTLGSRALLAVNRDLATWSFTLADALDGTERGAHRHNARAFHMPMAGRDGVRVLSAPDHAVPFIRTLARPFIFGAEQTYRRHYIDMRDGTYEAYLAGFSGKTRSTLLRKQRKLGREAGGYTVSEHRTPEQIEAFLTAARPLSAKTYQERHLDAGLPDTEQARATMIEQAQRDCLRAYLLWAGDTPIAYLTLPIIERTLIYAHLGYDPDWARLSPGTVLQLEALERLFAEDRFAYFDFTEGEGAHKALFGTHNVICASFVLLKPTLANRCLLSARRGFDAATAASKNLAHQTGALARIRSALRA